MIDPCRDTGRAHRYQMWGAFITRDGNYVLATDQDRGQAWPDVVQLQCMDCSARQLYDRRAPRVEEHPKPPLTATEPAIGAQH